MSHAGAKYRSPGESKCDAGYTGQVTYSKDEPQGCKKCVSTAADPRYVNNNVCAPCPRGNTCDGKTATPCDSNKYIVSNVCNTCPAGYTCNGITKEACASTKYVKKDFNTIRRPLKVNNDTQT